MNYLRPFSLFTWMFPSYFRIDESTKGIWLSFDDGPEPGVTDSVLKMLAEHQVRALFFLLGRNVQKNPELAKEIQSAGHWIGSHSQTHPDAWKTAPKVWNEDVRIGHETIASVLGKSPDFFRPPYGHFVPGFNQFPENSKTLLWTLMPGDFDEKFQGNDIVQRTLGNMRNREIIVLHDSLKAAPRLLSALPLILEGIEEKRFIRKAELTRIN